MVVLKSMHLEDAAQSVLHALLRLLRGAEQVMDEHNY